MDLVKAKIFLDKVNREFGRMSKDPENIARIDMDIMLSYIRDLYDTLVYAEPAAPPSHMPKIENKRRSTPTKSSPAEPSEPHYVEPPKPARVDPPTPPPVEEKPAPAPPPPPVVETPPPAPVVETPPPPPPVVAAPPKQDSLPPEAMALFEFKEAKELSEKLSQTPINDLSRAISLNDKLRMGNELFGGDNSLFEDAIKNLNNFSEFGQAKAYLIDNFVVKFDWSHDKREEIAKKLIGLINRRYK
jgi:hypothetical protein